MIARPVITTAEQLLDAGDIGRCELVRGELIMMSPTNPEHSKLMSRISHLLLLHVDSHPEQGEVHSGDPGFVISRNPDSVRAPDIALVTKSGATFEPDRGFFQGAPNLAIEILSPNDSASDVMDKVDDWLTAGTSEVWIIDPKRKSVMIHRHDQAARVLKGKDELTSESMLPGFRVPVAEVFR